MCALLCLTKGWQTPTQHSAGSLPPRTVHSPSPPPPRFCCCSWPPGRLHVSRGSAAGSWRAVSPCGLPAARGSKATSRESPQPQGREGLNPPRPRRLRHCGLSWGNPGWGAQQQSRHMHTFWGSQGPGVTLTAACSGLSAEVHWTLQGWGLGAPCPILGQLIALCPGAEEQVKEALAHPHLEVTLQGAWKPEPVASQSRD